MKEPGYYLSDRSPRRSRSSSTILHDKEASLPCPRSTSSTRCRSRSTRSRRPTRRSSRRTEARRRAASTRTARTCSSTARPSATSSSASSRRSATRATRCASSTPSRPAAPRLRRLLHVRREGLRRRRGPPLRARLARVHAGQAGRHVGQLLPRPPHRLDPQPYYYAANNPSEATIAKRRGYVDHLLPDAAAENAGLYKGLKELGELISSYQPVRENAKGTIANSIVATARRQPRQGRRAAGEDADLSS